MSVFRFTLFGVFVTGSLWGLCGILHACSKNYFRNQGCGYLYFRKIGQTLTSFKIEIEEEL